MKESKIIWFNNHSEMSVERDLREYEAKGWEVIEHQLAMSYNISGKPHKCISVLLQKEKE